MSEVFDLPVDENYIYEVVALDHGDDLEVITMAVNSHDKLVEALNQMHDRANTYGECLEIAEQALQAIKGEQRED